MLIILFIFYIPPVFRINGLRCDIGHNELFYFVYIEIGIHVTKDFELLIYDTREQPYICLRSTGLVLQVEYPCNIYIVVR